jgi:hypothetical protein
MFKEKIVKWFIYLVVIGVLTSSGWTMNKKPIESKQLAVSSEQLAKIKESSKKVKPESKLAKNNQGIAKEGTETLPGPQKNLIEEYVPKVIIKARWGSGPGEFGLFKQEMSGDHVMPNAIALDKEENLYILDPANGRVLKFTKNGNYIKAINLEGTDKKCLFKIHPGFFIDGSLAELVIDDDENIYIRTTGHCIPNWKYSCPVLKFSKDGKLLQKYFVSEGKSIKSIRNLQIVNNKVIARIGKEYIEFTSSGIVNLPSELTKKIKAEKKTIEERIDEMIKPLAKKEYTSFYGELIGKDKDNNLFVRVEAREPDPMYSIEKRTTMICKYSPKNKLLSIFAKREDRGFGPDRHKLLVTEKGIVYELWIPIEMIELPEGKPVYSPEGELWGYTSYEDIFPEYVKIIK